MFPRCNIYCAEQTFANPAYAETSGGAYGSQLQNHCVDFDGTLCYSNWPELGEPNTTLINYLLQEKAAGNKLILWTCRAGKALTDATRWCHEQGLTFDAVNDNLPEIVELYGNNSRKITCDLYIDDKSVFIDSMGRLQGAVL